MIAVELSFGQLVDAVKQLSPNEKLKLNEVIWKDNITIPVEHQQIVNERIKKSEADPEMLIDWEEAAKRLSL